MSNLRQPYLLAGGGFRYRVDLEVRQRDARHSITCIQGDVGSTDAYRCEGTGGVRSIVLAPQCSRGAMTTTSAARFTVEPWSERGLHVGFIVRDGSRPVAAIDTDHDWERPVWVAHGLADVERVAIDVLAYVLHDVFDAQSTSGFPFLCPELAAQRRYPRS